MGQEFSVEDFDVVNAGERYTNEAYIEHILREISRRIKQDNSGILGHLAYTRHRTRCGAPTVNRRSYGDEELKKFEVENDGFPLAATEDEIRVFDMSFLTGKHRKQKKKQRSRSLTEVASLAGIRMPVITRPKFVDKLITGATSLTRKSSFKDKRYKRQLSDQTQFYVDSPADPSPCYSTAEHIHVHQEGSSETTANSDRILLCSHCDQQVLVPEDLNSEPYEYGGRNISCSACGSEKLDRLCLRSSDDTSQAVNDRLEGVGDKPERLKDSKEEKVVNIVADAYKRVDDKSQRGCDKLEGVDDKAKKFCDKLEEGVGDQYNREDKFDKSPIVSEESETVVNTPEGVSCHYKKPDECESVGETLEGVDVEYETADYKYNSTDNFLEKTCYSLEEQACRTSVYGQNEPEFTNKSSQEHKLALAVSDTKSSFEAHEGLVASIPQHECQQNLLNNRRVVDRSSCETHEKLANTLPQSDCQRNLLLNSGVEKSETKSQDTGNRLRQYGASSLFRGHVKRHCEAFSKFGQPDQTVTYRKLAPCSKSDIHVTSNPAFLKNQNLHKGCQNLQTEGPKRWQKNYMNHARDKTFPQAVMAKGFVKALADQINQQGALRHVIEGEGSEEANEMSASVLSISDCRAGEMHTSQIHVVEEESKQLQRFQENETAGQISESLTENSLSVNGSDSSPLSVKTHGQAGCSSTSDEVSQCLEEENTQFPENGEFNDCETPGASVSSSPAQNLCNMLKQQSVKSLSNSASINLPGQNAQTTPSSDSQTLPPHSRQKPAVDYSSKPRTHKHSASRKALVNNHKTSVKSSIDSPPSLSSSTVSKTEPHWPSCEPMTMSFSESTHTTEFPQLDQSCCATNAKAGASSQVSVNASHLHTQCSHSRPPNSHNSSSHTSSNLPTTPDHNVSTSLSECMDTHPSQAGCDPDPLYRLNGYEGVALRAVSKRSSEQYRDSVFNTIYDNAPPISAAELFDSSWSDSDSFNDFSDDDDDDGGENPDKNYRNSKLSSKEQAESKITDQPEACLRGRRFWIVEELLNTERDYVARLHLLHHVFYFRLDKENRHQTFLPPDTLKNMFSNTKSIFLFHHDFLLPQLDDRIKSWETNPRIGDLMKKNAPFLKMYTEYIRNFDRAMKLINQWMEKSAKFSEIIQDIQKLPECRNLSLQHHMLGPIQRVPRYELLLKDYVKHLPEGSPDYTDAKDALDLVTKAACHSNEAMKKIETFHKLLDIYQSLRGVPVDFISPTREFVTQGPVTKIAARSGERQPRQIFLFNDLVLICTQYNLLGTYSVRSLLEVESMEIKAGTNFHIPNTFVVHSKQKVVELLDENSTGEPFLWQEKIQSVISKYKERKRSIKPDEPRELSSDISVPESCLGKTAPVWMQDDAATMCMLCNLSFNVVRRRHHCRACGKLICKTCCKKAPLEYMNGKTDRVCAMCYNVIVNKHCMTSSSESSTGRTSPKKKGILHVKASEPGVNSGYLQCSEDGGHNWNMFWITAHKDFVLYFFKAHEDVTALSSLPLPGHEVNQVWDIEGRPHVFCLSHKKKKVYWFQTDNEKHLKRWISVLEKLVQAELPEESSRLSSQSSSSNGSSASDGGGNINGNNRSSTHSGSQADSGYPGDSNNSLAALAVDQNDQENADGISQYDNVDGVVSE